MFCYVNLCQDWFCDEREFDTYAVSSETWNWNQNRKESVASRWSLPCWARAGMAVFAERWACGGISNIAQTSSFFSLFFPPCSEFLEGRRTEGLDYQHQAHTSCLVVPVLYPGGTTVSSTLAFLLKCRWSRSHTQQHAPSKLVTGVPVFFCPWTLNEPGKLAFVWI